MTHPCHCMSQDGLKELPLLTSWPSWSGFRRRRLFTRSAEEGALTLANSAWVRPSKRVVVYVWERTTLERVYVDVWCLETAIGGAENRSLIEGADCRGRKWRVKRAVSRAMGS